MHSCPLSISHSSLAHCRQLTKLDLDDKRDGPIALRDTTRSLVVSDPAATKQDAEPRAEVARLPYREPQPSPFRAATDVDGDSFREADIALVTITK